MKSVLVWLVVPVIAAAQQARTGPAGREPAVRQPDASQQSQAAPAKAEDLCAVEGQVVNGATGEPLGKAAVTLRRVDSPRGAPGPAAGYGATSDASGKFTIIHIEPGKYRLSASRTGFVDAEYGSRDFLQGGTPVSLAPAQRMRDVQFRMTPHGVITGRVLDAEGEPMAFLQVQAMRYRYPHGRKQLVAYGSAATNDLGEYRIFGLPPGRYFVSVSNRQSYLSGRPAPGATQDPEEEYVPTYYPGTSDPTGAAALDVGAGVQIRGVDLVPSKRRTVHVKGNVTDASGSDGRRLMVFLMPRGVSGLGAMNRPSTIDANGNFDIRGVASGSYTLVAALQERGRPFTSRLPVEVGNNNIENLSITINPAMNLPGRVRLDGQTAADISNVQVTLRSRDANVPMFGANTMVRLKEDGSFSLANVNPDNYSVTVSGLPDGFYVKSIMASGQDALVSGLNLTTGAAAAIDILLAPNAGQATGVVQNEQQQPAAGVTVVLIPQEKERSEQSQYYKTATTDAAGAFTLKNLDPGQYKIYAWREVEPGAYMDPEFVKPVENRGESLTIRESSQASVQLKLI